MDNPKEQGRISAEMKILEETFREPTREELYARIKELKQKLREAKAEAKEWKRLFMSSPCWQYERKKEKP